MKRTHKLRIPACTFAFFGLLLLGIATQHVKAQEYDPFECGRCNREQCFQPYTEQARACDGDIACRRDAVCTVHNCLLGCPCFRDQEARDRQEEIRDRYCAQAGNGGGSGNTGGTTGGTTGGGTTGGTTGGSTGGASGGGGPVEPPPPPPGPGGTVQPHCRGEQMRQICLRMGGYCERWNCILPKHCRDPRSREECERSGGTCDAARRCIENKCDPRQCATQGGECVNNKCVVRPTGPQCDPVSCKQRGGVCEHNECVRQPGGLQGGTTNSCADTCINRFAGSKNLTSTMLGLVRNECNKRCGAYNNTTVKPNTNLPPAVTQQNNVQGPEQTNQTPVTRPPVIRPSTRPENQQISSYGKCMEVGQGKASHNALHYYCQKRYGAPEQSPTRPPEPQQPTRPPEPQNPQQPTRPPEGLSFAPNGSEHLYKYCLAKCEESIGRNVPGIEIAQKCAQACKRFKPEGNGGNNPPPPPPTPQPDPPEQLRECETTRDCRSREICTLRRICREISDERCTPQEVIQCETARCYKLAEPRQTQHHTFDFACELGSQNPQGPTGGGQPNPTGSSLLRCATNADCNRGEFCSAQQQCFRSLGSCPTNIAVECQAFRCHRVEESPSNRGYACEQQHECSDDSHCSAGTFCVRGNNRCIEPGTTFSSFCSSNGRARCQQQGKECVRSHPNQGSKELCIQQNSIGERCEILCESKQCSSGTVCSIPQRGLESHLCLREGTNPTWHRCAGIGGQNPNQPTRPNQPTNPQPDPPRQPGNSGGGGGGFMSLCLQRCLTVELQNRAGRSNQQILELCRNECSQPTPQPDPEPRPEPRPEPPRPEGPRNEFERCVDDCMDVIISNTPNSNREEARRLCSIRCDRASPTGNGGGGFQPPRPDPQNRCFFDRCRNIPIPNPEFECQAPTIAVDCGAPNCNIGPCTNPAPPPPSAPPPPPQEPRGPSGPTGFRPNSSSGGCESNSALLNGASNPAVCRSCLRFACKIANGNTDVAGRACKVTCK